MHGKGEEGVTVLVLFRQLERSTYSALTGAVPGGQVPPDSAVGTNPASVAIWKNGVGVDV